jgi:hypothetical protein
MLERKQYATYIQPIDVRLEAVKRFLTNFRPKLDYRVGFLWLSCAKACSYFIE